MDRINGADWVDIGGGRRGFRSEDLVNGIVGTEVTALWLNVTQEEIIKVIEGAGLVLDPADWTQLFQALQIMGLSIGARARRWTSVISMTLSSAPGAPAGGDTYLVPAGATGIWSTHVGAIAEWNGAAWSYVIPPNGHGIGLPDGRVFIRVGGVYISLTASQTASQADVNAGLVNNLFVTPLSLAQKAPVYISAQSAGQSLPSTVYTALTAMTTLVAALDDATFVSGALTIGPKTAGKWQISATVGLGTITAGAVTKMFISRNGTNIAFCDGGQAKNAATASSPGVALTLIFDLVAGDVIRFGGYHDASGSQPISVLSTFFNAVRLGG